MMGKKETYSLLIKDMKTCFTDKQLENFADIRERSLFLVDNIIHLILLKNNFKTYRKQDMHTNIFFRKNAKKEGFFYRAICFEYKIEFDFLSEFRKIYSKISVSFKCVNGKYFFFLEMFPFSYSRSFRKEFFRFNPFSEIFWKDTDRFFKEFCNREKNE